MNNLKGRTVKGIGWVTVAQLIRLILTFVVTAILARLLEPDDFGLVAMVVVFTNFAAILNDIGLPAALVQSKEITEEQKSSSFWVNLLEGLLITLVLAALSPLIAGFYSKSQLIPIVIVLSSTFFISSFGMIQSGLLARDMDFKKLALIETTAAFAAGAVAVAMAFAGFGVWSLVFQQVVASLVTAILLFFLCGWKPGLTCRWRPIKQLFRFGINLTGFNVINYFSRNLDNLLIGRFLGSISLGFYSLAYRVFLLPLQTISGVVGRVMFPALSSMQEERERVREVYIRATRLIALVTFPMSVGLLVVAPQFIRVVFGDKWARAILVIQVLALVGLVQSIATTLGWIFQSQGRTDIMFRWGLFATTVAVTAFIIGLRWDIEGVAVAYAIASLLLVYPAFFLAFRLIGLKVHHYFQRLGTVALSTAIMGGLSYAFRVLFERTLGLGDLVVLASTVVVSVITYTAAVSLLDKALVVDAFGALKALKGGRA